MSDILARLAAALEGRYVVEREIGVGGMARVYLARDLKHHRDVALKVLRPELASSLGAERFLREIEISARLSHPHILTLIDSGTADDLLYFVLPYVEGESLEEWIERDGPLPLADVVRITEQVASALEYAHEEGVIHRDIKPSNVLIHRGEAVVSDFGIAVGVEMAGGERLTGLGLALGSPAYMSPEQARGQEKVDERADIYSLGCVVYEMLTGVPPFEGGSFQAVLAQILTSEPKGVDSHRADLPRSVAEAVARALAVDPVERFARPTDFAAALRAGLSSEARATAGLRRRTWAIVASVAVAILAGAGWLAALGRADVRAREAVAAAEQAIDMAAWEAAYRMTMSLPEAVDDSVRQRLLSEVTVEGTIATDPAGAQVSWRPLLEPDAGWEGLGTTPLTTRLPVTNVLLRLELVGHRTRLLWSGWASAPFPWPLRPEDADQPGGLYVPGGMVNPGVLAGGIWEGDDREVGDYLLDPYEVTNREYAEFVQAGGYQRPEFWEDGFVRDGRRLTWAEAMAELVDRTGRPGPSTWELGRHREGTADSPVTGVSWYEAAAYARFRGRDLPTLYHWYRAAVVQVGQFVVPLSNFGDEGPAPVGRFPGVTPTGAFDMAGNAREWMANAAGAYRLTGGGGWADEAYSFALAQPLSPFDRSESNGLRLMTNLGDTAMMRAAAAPVAYFQRDFASETPVSDEVFGVYRGVYAYDATPLNAVVERTDTVQPGILRQRVTFDAGYGGERMVLYLFLPAGEPELPRQAVLLFPGSQVFNLADFETDAGPRSRTALIVRSGRVLAFPVIDGSYERRDGFVYPLQDESNAYRDRVISWYRDVARSLDYLETRPDIDADRLGYFGHSLGGRMGAIMLALEPRFRAGVLYVAGLSPKPTQAVVDPFNYLRHVRAPVRVISGQFDPIYPLELSARPFFEGLGSDVKDHYVAAGAHNVPWPQLARQTLEWFDTYLGPVR